MELLKEIDDNEVGEIEKKRKAARGIFFDKENLMPILFVSKYNYHKIPGGGAENDEELEMALRREIFEETGCEVEVAGEVGKIIEYRRKWNLKQESFCWYGKITKKGEVSFTEEEVGHGLILNFGWDIILSAITVGLLF